MTQTTEGQNTPNNPSILRRILDFCARTCDRLLKEDRTQTTSPIPSLVLSQISIPSNASSFIIENETPFRQPRQTQQVITTYHDDEPIDIITLTQLENSAFKKESQTEGKTSPQTV